MTENVNGYRTYDSGASRDTGINKMEVSRCLHPAVIKRFAKFMLSKNTMPDGSYRRGDNWQKGIPEDDVIESLERHNLDIWLHTKGWGLEATEDLQIACCAALFNIQAILLKELEKQRETNPRIPTSSDGKSEEALHRDRAVDNGSIQADGSAEINDQRLGSERELDPVRAGGPDGGGLHGPAGIRDRTIRRLDSKGEAIYFENTEPISQPESKA